MFGANAGSAANRYVEAVQNTEFVPENFEQGAIKMFSSQNIPGGHCQTDVYEYLQTSNPFQRDEVATFSPDKQDFQSVASLNRGWTGLRNSEEMVCSRSCCNCLQTDPALSRFGTDATTIGADACMELPREVSPNYTRCFTTASSRCQTLEDNSWVVTADIENPFDRKTGCCHSKDLIPETAATAFTVDSLSDSADSSYVGNGFKTQDDLLCWELPGVADIPVLQRIDPRETALNSPGNWFRPELQKISSPSKTMLSLNYDSVLNAWKDVEPCTCKDPNNRLESINSESKSFQTFRTVKLNTSDFGRESSCEPDLPSPIFAEDSLKLRSQQLKRYRDKREKRKYSQGVRYALRKANADQRPRVKGRFVKKSEEPAAFAAAQDTK
uniref:CCT domain-containing protein n=1 Tax=Tetraselmis sp. GSL018 TaxID=582737 RepID=A0A061QXT2_9CHLO|mmetsp:Transcript_17607/g.42226  ORF Transcript_17607/g.42226 Transcript_17607/m.42226 type:complete len:384 (-) Transcript_17607:297-1448(-)